MIKDSLSDYCKDFTGYNVRQLSKIVNVPTRTLYDWWRSEKRRHLVKILIRQAQGVDIKDKSMFDAIFIVTEYAGVERNQVFSMYESIINLCPTVPQNFAAILASYSINHPEYWSSYLNTKLLSALKNLTPDNKCRATRLMYNVAVLQFNSSYHYKGYQGINSGVIYYGVCKLLNSVISKSLNSINYDDLRSTVFWITDTKKDSNLRKLSNTALQIQYNNAYGEKAQQIELELTARGLFSLDTHDSPHQYSCLDKAKTLIKELNLG